LFYERRTTTYRLKTIRERHGAAWEWFSRPPPQFCRIRCASAPCVIRQLYRPLGKDIARRVRHYIITAYSCISYSIFYHSARPRTHRALRLVVFRFAFYAHALYTNNNCIPISRSRGHTYIYTYVRSLLIMIYGRKKNFLAERFQEGKSCPAVGLLIIGWDILLYINSHYAAAATVFPILLLPYTHDLFLLAVVFFLLVLGKRSYRIYTYVRVHTYTYVIRSDLYAVTWCADAALHRKFAMDCRIHVEHARVRITLTTYIVCTWCGAPITVQK